MSDYISREAVKQIIAAQCEECDDACLEFDGIQPDCNQCLLYGAKKAIESLPAADVRPVVKAHWTDHRTIEHDGEWYCSACGKEITIYMGPDRDDRYSYCPNCGADMRGEQDV